MARSTSGDGIPAGRMRRAAPVAALAARTAGESVISALRRLESPVQLVARTAREDVRIADTAISAGEQVLICLGAANRDPAVFAEPDRLQFGRSASPHLGLGHGAHFCAGASLARVETQEVVRRLVALSPSLERHEAQFERGNSPAFRRMTALSLTVS